ncbi:MAG: LacI family DNA-binding transcriptional regulator [Chthoniobacteraceae bacterium]
MSDRPINSRVSLRDIAKSLGLSHSTVSLALRNHPRISEPVRTKIQQKAEEMGYEPDPMLTALAYYRKSRQETPVRTAIAWLNAWKHPEQLRAYHEFDCYWKGASESAKKFGYHLEEFILNDELSPERLEGILHARSISAILIPPHQGGPDWGSFHWERFAAVRFGWSIRTPQVHLVTSDQAGNTLLAVDKIREKGYRRIGFVYGRGARNAMFQAGFLMGQAEMKPSERLPVLHLSESLPNDNAERLTAWLKKCKPDAILTDHAPLPGMLQKLGYQIPGELGLATLSVLDGNLDAGIDQNPVEIGRVAFLMAFTLINDNARGIPPIFRQTLVSGKWVDGKSLPDRS